MPGDTAPEVAARCRRLLSEMSGPRRLEIAAWLSRGARSLAEAGLRHRLPGAGEAELRRRLAALLYGREVAERAFGRAPDDVG